MPVSAEQIAALSARLDEVEGYLHFDDRRAEVASLEERSTKPGFWDDVDNARSVRAALASAKDAVSGIDSAR